MSLAETDAATVLRRLFDVVIRKAEQDPTFAADLISSLGIEAQLVVVRKKTETRDTSRRPELENIDPAGLLREGREDLLRSKLRQLTNEDIIALAKRRSYNIPRLSRMPKQARIDAVVQFALKRIASSEAYRE